MFYLFDLDLLLQLAKPTELNAPKKNKQKKIALVVDHGLDHGGPWASPMVVIVTK